MAFTREQVEEFIEALRADAELRERVRGAILSDDFQALPGLVRGLAEHIDSLTERLERFIAASDIRFARLEKRMDDVAGGLGNVEGEVFEWKYDRQASGRLGQRYRNVRVLRLGDEPEMHAALADGRLSDDDWDEAILADCVVRGISKVTGDEAVLVIEVSKTVDDSDVYRASRRAEILRRIWPAAVAAVDGDQILPSAKEKAMALGVTTVVRREAPAPPAA